MQKWFGAQPSWVVSAVIAGSLLLGVGCSPQAKQSRHLARAAQYFKAEKYQEAGIEYMNVLKVAPTNRVAVRGMALTLFAMGEVRAAIPCLLKVEELDPGDIEVRLKLGTLYLIMGDRVRARQRAESILKKDPGNLDALVMWGAGASSSNEVESAIARLTAVASKLADKPRFYVTLASLYMSRGELDEAAEIYRKALEKIPKSWEVHLAMGDLCLLKRDLIRAGQEYQTAADLAPAASIARIKLARFHLARGNKVEAKKILDDLVNQAPRFSAAALCRAELALSERDHITALKIVDGILKTEPSNLEAFLLMQQVKLAQGKVEEAITAYEKVVNAFPKAAQGRYLLGTAWFQKGDLPKAMAECERAVALDADHQESVRLLAELNIRSGRPDAAQALLKPFLNRHPGSGFAYVLMGTAYTAKNDFTQAVAVYRELMKAMPDNPQGAYLLGQVLRRAGRDAEATAMFEEALKLDPRSMEVMEQLATMAAVHSKDWAAAVNRIEKQIAIVPDAAGLHYLLGNALSQKRDWDRAEKAFQKAIDLKPEITAAYVGLSYVYLATDKEDQALRKLDNALSVSSNDVASLMMKGMLLVNKKEPARAAAQYQRILDVNPAFLPALNNLACLCQDQLNMKDKAYEFARQARTIAPRDPRVADTLGWILFHRREYKWALTLLQESVEQLEGQPEILYHLGMCQAAMGDAQNARASFSKALERAKSFPGSAEAAEMLTVLSAGGDLKELSSTGQVEEFLAKHPDNPFALIKGGAFYEHHGNDERAEKLYEKALTLNDHFVPALISLAKLWSDHPDQLDRALSFAKQAREKAPGDPLVADTLADLAFRKGDYRWAQSLLTESINRAGATPERQCALGMVLYACGKTDDATNLIGQALSASSELSSSSSARRLLEHVRSPDLAAGRIREDEITRSLTVEHLPLLMYVAGTHERKGDAIRARSLYETAVARYPDFSPAFRRLALLYDGKKTISDQEFKVLGKARELLPDDPDVGRVLGAAAYRKGQYEWASRLLKESTGKFPDRADGYYFLGMSLRQLRSKDAARKALSRALELAPRSELAPAAREILSQVQ